MLKKPLYLFLTLIGCLLIGFTVFQLSGIFLKNKQNNNSSAQISSVIDSNSTQIANSSLISSSFSSSSSFSTLISNLKNWQTYTNPLFPTLKISYPDSWKFSTSTVNSNYPGLLVRKNLLTKDGFEFEIATTPLIVKGCAVDPDMIKVNEFKKLGNNIYKTKFLNTETKKSFIHYSTSQIAFGGCDLSSIKSNIDTSTIPEFQKNFPDKTKIEFFISLSEIEETSTNTQTLQELDEILAKSQL